MFCEPERIYYEKLNKYVLRKVTFYSEDKNGPEVSFKGEKLTISLLIMILQNTIELTKIHSLFLSWRSSFCSYKAVEGDIFPELRICLIGNCIKGNINKSMFAEDHIIEVECLGKLSRDSGKA